MMDSWMDLYILVMISAVNEHSVAEEQLISTIATWNMIYDGSSDGFVHFGHDIYHKWAQCSRITASFNYCDLEHVL